MEPEDIAILDTVISVVRRYGMKRTTMAEIAQGAGVSRQTLYDRFGDKDEIMAATIDLIVERVCAELKQAFSGNSGLDQKLDAYFTIVVWPIFEALQSMPDAADFENGQGPASIAASQRGAVAKQAVLADVFRDQLAPNGPAPEQVARFFEQASSRAKASGISSEELAGFLAVLKASTLALAAPQD